MAAAVMAASSSGVGRMVSGLSFGMAFYLSLIGLAQVTVALGLKMARFEALTAKMV
jgi:hypothetical protein